MKRIFLALIVFMAATGLLLWLFPDRVEPDAGNASDKLCADLLTHKEHVEALSWLQQSRPGNERTLGEHDPAHSLAIVESLYDSGARKVHALDIDKEPGIGETANILCTELPDDKAKRQKLFKIEARKASAEGFSPMPDQGQAYLFMFKFKLGLWEMLSSLVGRWSSPEKRSVHRTFSDLGSSCLITGDACGTHNLVRCRRQKPRSSAERQQHHAPFDGSLRCAVQGT
jgi:hypothetical protein